MEFLQEKEERRKLEEKIKKLQSNVLIGGQHVEETPQFAMALEQKQKAIWEEYDERLLEIEKEREQIEQDKA